jgi:hypothetical protein
MSNINISKPQLFLLISAFVLSPIFNSLRIYGQTGGAPVAPKVGGRAYQMPNYPEPTMSKEDFEKFVQANLTKTLSPPPKATPPPAENRSRGGSTYSPGCSGAQSLLATGYKGRCEIYQFTNDDFPNRNNSCGQAAIATAMWTIGLKDKYASDHEFAKSIWAYAPPKITLGNLIQLQGSLGSDWRQLNYALDGYGKLYGVKYSWITGEAEIKKYLAMNLPVVIMLDTGTLKQFNYQWFTGHWVTAFGYDKDYIYVSNFPESRMSWAELGAAFRGNLAQLHGTSGRAMVVWK